MIKNIAVKTHKFDFKHIKYNPVLDPNELQCEFHGMSIVQINAVRRTLISDIDIKYMEPIDIETNDPYFISQLEEVRNSIISIPLLQSIPEDTKLSLNFANSTNGMKFLRISDIHGIEGYTNTNVKLLAIHPGCYVKCKTIKILTDTPLNNPYLVAAYRMTPPVPLDRSLLEKSTLEYSGGIIPCTVTLKTNGGFDPKQLLKTAIITLANSIPKTFDHNKKVNEFKSTYTLSSVIQEKLNEANFTVYPEVDEENYICIFDVSSIDRELGEKILDYLRNLYLNLAKQL